MLRLIIGRPRTQMPIPFHSINSLHSFSYFQSPNMRMETLRWKFTGRIILTNVLWNLNTERAPRRMWKRASNEHFLSFDRALGKMETQPKNFIAILSTRYVGYFFHIHRNIDFVHNIGLIPTESGKFWNYRWREKFVHFNDNHDDRAENDTRRSAHLNLSIFVLFTKDYDS